MTGWCDVRVAVAPRTIVARPLHGPFFDLSALGDCGFEVVATHGLVMFRGGERTELPPAAAPRVYAVDTLLWAGSDGRLETIEVVCHGDGDLVDPYSAFVWAATLYPPVLRYPPTA